MYPFKKLLLLLKNLLILRPIKKKTNPGPGD